MTYRMGENICKRWAQQGVNVQNVQTVHTTQYKKKKKQITQSKKWADTWIDIPKEEIYGQQALREMQIKQYRKHFQKSTVFIWKYLINNTGVSWGLLS